MIYCPRCSGSVMLWDATGESVCPVCGHRTYPVVPKPVETMDIKPPRRSPTQWVKGQRPGAEMLNQCEAPRNEGGRCVAETGKARRCQNWTRHQNMRCYQHPSPSP